jgi:hypothetical protein
MLWVYVSADRWATPCVLGESTWTAISRHYPGVGVQHAADGPNLFRFIDPSDGYPLCFAAGIQIPEGQESVASAIAGAAWGLDSTGDGGPGEAPQAA